MKFYVVLPFYPHYIYIYFLVVPCCTTSSHSSSVAWLLIWPFETIQLMPVDGEGPGRWTSSVSVHDKRPDPFWGISMYITHLRDHFVDDPPTLFVQTWATFLNCNEKMRKRIRSTRWALDFFTEFGGLYFPPPPFKASIWFTMFHIHISSGWWFGTWLLFFHIGNFMIPIDELIFFRGVGIPPTSHISHYIHIICYNPII